MRNLLLFTFIFFFSNIYCQSVFPENIVFEGAGVRGIAYSGVIRTLEQRDIIQHIKRVGGTSAGAITALMVSLGYNSVEIYKIISDTKFQKFNDGEFFFVGGLSRIKTRYGWYKGNEFTKWLEKIIKDKTGNSEMTFSDLSEKKFKELYVTATCLNKQKLLVFSAETYPKMKIKDAVRISMSIPIYFEAVFIDSLGRVHKKQHSGKNLDVVVDGGIIGNFPIFIFDSIRTNSSLNTRIPNYKTIGVRIDTDSQIQNDSLSKELVPIDIKNFSDYLTAFYVLTLEKLNRATLVSQDWERTISVSSVGIGPKIKKLSADQKAALIKSGEDFTSMFLDKMPSKIFKP